MVVGSVLIMVKDIRFDRRYAVRRTNEWDNTYMYRTPNTAEVDTAFIAGAYKKPRPVELTRKHLSTVVSHEKMHGVLLHEHGRSANDGLDDREVILFIESGISPRRKTDFAKWILYLNRLRREILLIQNDIYPRFESSETKV